MDENRTRWLIEIVLSAILGALATQFFALGLPGLILLIIILVGILVAMTLFEFISTPRLRDQKRLQSLKDELEKLKEEITRLEQIISELDSIIREEIDEPPIDTSTYVLTSHIQQRFPRVKNEGFKILLQRIFECRNDILKSQQQIKKLKKETDKLETASLDIEGLSRLEKEAGKIAEVLYSLDDTLIDIKIAVNSYRAERLQRTLPREAEPLKNKTPKQQSPSRLEVDDEKPVESDDDDKGDEDKPLQSGKQK